MVKELPDRNVQELSLIHDCMIDRMIAASAFCRGWESMAGTS